MKRMTLLSLLLIPIMGMGTTWLMGKASKGLELKDITSGVYRAEGISALVPSKDGES